MNYFFSQTMPAFWQMLSRMIEEKYSHAYHPDDVLLMGCNFASCTQLKSEYFPNNNGKIIVYQLEPLIENHWHNKNKILENLKDADEVWDYNLENIDVLKQHGIHAKFKPLLHADCLKQIDNKEDPDIDVLFYGSFTDHRSNFFRDVTNNFVVTSDLELYRKINYVTLFNIDDKKLDSFISRSKIILNLHPHDDQNMHQQQTRIFYPLINQKCVMSEKSTNNYFGDCIVEFDGFQDFGEKLIHLLKTDDWKNYPNKCRDWNSFVNNDVRVTKTFYPLR